MMNKWWGYRHTNGSYQAKRFFDDRDLEEAMESPFVDKLCEPFVPEKVEGESDRDSALRYIENKLKDR